MFLREDESGRECLDEAACASAGLEPFVRDRNTRICIPLAQCPENDGYFLRDGQKTTCVSASACSELEKYAYKASRECSAQEPNLEGNFDQDAKKRHVYECDSNNPYLDANGELAACIPAEECVQSARLLYEDDAGDRKQCLSAKNCSKTGFALRIQCLTQN